MPARPRKTDDVTPAQAAAAEAGLSEPTPDVPAGMVKVPFRGVDLLVADPEKATKSAKIRLAFASGDDARFFAALLGERTSRQVENMMTDEDDFTTVITEFFDAYGKATGQGNS